MSAQRRTSDPSQRLYRAVWWVAQRAGVDERTVRRWCENGQVISVRLPSGQYRIEVDEAGFPVKPEGAR